MKGKFYDIVSFLSLLTLRKILNYIRLKCSFFLSRILKKVYIKALPSSISIEPTSLCNLQCLECPSGQKTLKRPSGNIDGRLFRKIIDESHRYILTATLYFQGEPFLHKFFLKMIEYASKKKIYTITSTNGHFLDATTAERVVNSGLNRIIVSLDGTTQETYSAYRIGGNLETVVEGISNLVKAKRMLKSRTPYVVVQFLVNRHNENQLAEAKKLAKEIGVDKLVFKTMQLLEETDNHGFLPSDKRFSRYNCDNGGKLQLKNHLPNKCFRMWHSCVITWEGDVVPCCFDKDAEQVMGNINSQGIHEIWFNKMYTSFRRKILYNRKGIAMCRNCTEGLKK